MRNSGSFRRPTARAVLVAVAAGAVLLPIAGMSSAAPPASSPEVVHATTVQVTSAAPTPAAVAQGDPMTLIAAVTPSTATGSVQFMDGTASLGTPVAVTNGIAWTTTSTSMLAVGSHALTAVFIPADTAYSPSASSALPLTVATSEAVESLPATSNAQPSGQSLDAPVPAGLPVGPLGIPGVMLDAYQRAERVMAQTQPNCNLSWATLAAIGKIESGHASGGRVDTAGNTLGPILGPQLDGSLADTVAIVDTDRGTLDADPGWDRAVGPMQFIPASWRVYGAGNPSNIYDSTLAAGRYLCAGGADLSDPSQQALAVYRYNHSMTYVRDVMRWTQGYLTGVFPTPSELGLVPQVTDSSSTVRVRPVAQLDAPTVVNLDQPPPAQLDAAPATPAAPASNPVSLDSP